MGSRALLSLVALAATLVGPALRAAPSLSTHPALTYFSTLSELPFARLEAESIGPRYTRHGPFRVPAPGVDIRSPTLTLHDQPCTPADWTGLLKELSAWRGLPGSAELLLILPDARLFAFLRPPRIDAGVLSGLVRPVVPTSHPATSPAPLLLHVSHDGDNRLRYDFRPRESTPLVAFPARSAPTENAPPSP